MSGTYGPGIQVIPSGRRLVRSLRDLGYDFVHAVADLVDNSIAARASEVAITMKFDGSDSRVIGIALVFPASDSAATIKWVVG